MKLMNTLPNMMKFKAVMFWFGKKIFFRQFLVCKVDFRQKMCVFWFVKMWVWGRF